MGSVLASLISIVKKSRLSVIAATFVLAVLSINLSGLVHTGQVAGASCPAQTRTPQFNIVWCGLSGSTTADYVSSLQYYYNLNRDGSHIDLHTVYAWSNPDAATIVPTMNASNTKIGYLYENASKDNKSDGILYVDGQVVGTETSISARWHKSNPDGSPMAGFQQIAGTDGVWTRPATTWLDDRDVTSEKVIVHFNQAGEADFAVETTCGNGLHFKPVPKPKELVCVELARKDESNNAFLFTATASAQNTAVSSYAFDFGDGKQATVSSSNLQATTSHTYSQPGTYTAKVAVSGPDFQNVTAPACMTQIVIAPPSSTPPPQTQTPPPTQLVNTGPGDVLGAAGLTTAVGGLVHHFVARRKPERE